MARIEFEKAFPSGHVRKAARQVLGMSASYHGVLDERILTRQKILDAMSMQCTDYN